MADADKVGRRVSCEGHRGTVRYFGPVAPTEGEWYGVEWDDETRGKHDGTHDGVRYFHCRHATGGSFMRPKKVDFGVTVVRALYQRYGKSNTKLNPDELYVVSNGRKTMVEMVGEDSVLEQQSQFEKLKEVSLRNLFVSGADKELELHRVCPNVAELDLAQNLLSSWDAVAGITANLQSLKRLDVSGNFLTLPKDPRSLETSFNTISTLFINRSALTWDQVLTIISMMPALQELHICHNCIRDLRSKDVTEHKLEGLQKIEMLNLQGNQLNNWEEVLGSLPRLQSLILSDTGISYIKIKPRGSDEHQSFASLKSLFLSDNNIAELASINQLHLLPQLADLRFKRNPVFKDESSYDSRQQLIACIGSLKTLNGSPVNPRERAEAERAYLKRYAQSWIQAGGSSKTVSSCTLKQAFLEQHPRYLDLVKEHGPPPDDGHNITKTLKDSLISVNFKCPDAADKKQVTKKLPGTMTVGKLKGLFYRLYKIDSADQKLSYVDSKIGREIELDDDLRQLTFYSVESGDTILVRW